MNGSIGRMGDVVVRPRVAADMDACVALLAEVYALGHYPTNWPRDPLRWLSRRACAAWVAVLAGQVVGHAMVAQQEGEPAELARLFVKPSLFRNGIGAALTAAATGWADERRLPMVLSVNVKSEGAWAAYERWGWQRVDTQLADWTTPASEPVLLHYYERAAMAK